MASAILYPTARGDDRCARSSVSQASANAQMAKLLVGTIGWT